MTHLPANLPSVIKTAAPFVSHYGYFGVAGLLLLESAGLPIPGETTLIMAALFAGIGQLNIFLVILVGVLAAVIGDNIAYGIGTLIGRGVIEKYGKYFLIPPSRFNKLEAFFNRNGPKVVLIARFVDVLRQLNGIIAGISTMRWSRFVLYNVIGAVLWVITWTGIEYFAGNHVQTLLKYEVYFSIFIGLLVIIVISKKIFEKIRSRAAETKEKHE